MHKLIILYKFLKKKIKLKFLINLKKNGYAVKGIIIN